MARRDRGNHPLSARVQKALRSLEDHPGLHGLLPAMAPRTLTRLYDAVGLHDAGSLMAITPANQLVHALDEAVWTHDGVDTRFDPDVFVDWLEVWLGEGAAFTAERLLLLDEDFLALGFATVMRVADAEVEGFERTVAEQGDEPPGMDPEAAVVDRFLIAPVQEDEGDVVQQAVVALWDHDPSRALTLLERLARLPLDAHPAAVLHHDAAAAREAVGERSGFVPPAAARAFLATAGAAGLVELCAMTEYDLETARHLGRLAAASALPVVAAEPANAPAPFGRADTGTEAESEIWRLLGEAGVLDGAPPAALLAGPGRPQPLTLQRRLDDAAAESPDRLAHAAAELAWLANVLITGVGLMISGGRREEQARELAFATANLGIELLEHRESPVVLGEPPGLVRAFLVGWRVLDELRASLPAAFERAFASPAMAAHLEPRVWLRQEMDASLEALAAAVAESRLDAAREAVGLLSLACHTASCRAAAHLLGHPPRFPLLLEGGGKDEARWIRSLDDVERLSALLDSLGPKA